LTQPSHVEYRSCPCERRPEAEATVCEEESRVFLFDGIGASLMPFRVRFSAATTCVHRARPRDFQSKFVRAGAFSLGVEAVY
jgi:hypothetical protein